MQYREAEMADINALRELEQRVVEAERPFDSHIRSGKPVYYDIESLITSDDSCLLVCENSGEIVATGYAQIRQSKKSLAHEVHSYLGFMYVSPDWRGKGLNKNILEQLQEWSLAKGVSNLYLEVYSANSAAVRAYEKAGFEPCLLEMKLCL